ncbi:uncharacterized protein BDZ83DRAFT_727220 [Colletotrichum acutatum]|uniref:Uncharacterized protein n=1 Tax=Glomerella acutata TaxID=27357 RepID=A0AAD8XLH0_GLOAC|nr:uncharacterized protein BDZ83DRAFT_727220 [Colletotrichum acutatum]KAK1729514.1 hypothetical protein BDZ83DRAFT_727220 [Colletotrichum acutatum]
MQMEMLSGPGYEQGLAPKARPPALNEPCQINLWHAHFAAILAAQNRYCPPAFGRDAPAPDAPERVVRWCIHCKQSIFLILHTGRRVPRISSCSFDVAVILRTDRQYPRDFFWHRLKETWKWVWSVGVARVDEGCWTLRLAPLPDASTKPMARRPDSLGTRKASMSALPVSPLLLAFHRASGRSSRCKLAVFHGSLTPFCEFC